MKETTWFGVKVGVALWFALSNCTSAQETRKPVQSIWRPLPSAQEEGLLAERVELWRTNRLWHISESGYLLSGYETRPGVHPWQGEHVGKWLHAATLAHEATGDQKLGRRLHETVKRLLATQQADGYLGTYAKERRFYSVPADKGSWDVWSHRYNLYGLLTYERFHPDGRIVSACERMGDLLITAFDEGKADLTQNGTRQGISSTTVLESMMMLYERTQEERFLKFAEHIVQCSENAPGLRLMGAMLAGEDVSGPGDGKAYQLMANLLGYLLLYRNTGDDRYLTTVRNGWENIKADHLYVTGGPWSRKMPYNGNKECFALPEDFSPHQADVETCSTTTWIQLNLHLLELTGRAKYAVEAERAVFNALLAAQYGEGGIEWCYFTRANQDSRAYNDKFHCCASSGPRALEMFAHYLIGEVEGGISLANLAPCSAVLPDSLGGAKIKVMGNYPRSPRIKIRLEEAHDKEFAVEFRDPADSRMISARINGHDVALSKNDRGFCQVSRAWTTGDEITLEFEYLLKSHIETPKAGQSWVAFTFGPWALAQTRDKGVVVEPFLGKDVQSKAASQWLEFCSPHEGAEPTLRIRNTQILLGPFYSAGSKKAGTRTYFRF